MDPNHAIDAFNWLPENLIDAMTPKLIDGKPNTYTYTKHLAEQLVTQYQDKVPICIVRPSIGKASTMNQYKMSWQSVTILTSVTYGYHSCCYLRGSYPRMGGQLEWSHRHLHRVR